MIAFLACSKVTPKSLTPRGTVETKIVISQCGQCSQESYSEIENYSYSITKFLQTNASLRKDTQLCCSVIIFKEMFCTDSQMGDPMTHGHKLLCLETWKKRIRLQKHVHRTYFTCVYITRCIQLLDRIEKLWNRTPATLLKSLQIML